MDRLSNNSEEEPATAQTRNRALDRGLAKRNDYHVDKIACYLRKLDAIRHSDSSLLDDTAVLYRDGNVHNKTSYAA